MITPANLVGDAGKAASAASVGDSSTTTPDFEMFSVDEGVGFFREVWQTPVTSPEGPYLNPWQASMGEDLNRLIKEDAQWINSQADWYRQQLESLQYWIEQVQGGEQGDLGWKRVSDRLEQQYPDATFVGFFGLSLEAQANFDGERIGLIVEQAGERFYLLREYSMSSGTGFSGGTLRFFEQPNRAYDNFRIERTSEDWSFTADSPAGLSEREARGLDIRRNGQAAMREIIEAGEAYLDVIRDRISRGDQSIEAYLDRKFNLDENPIENAQMLRDMLVEMLRGARDLDPARRALLREQLESAELLLKELEGSEERIEQGRLLAQERRQVVETTLAKKLQDHPDWDLDGDFKLDHFTQVPAVYIDIVTGAFNDELPLFYTLRELKPELGLFEAVILDLDDGSVYRATGTETAETFERALERFRKFNNKGRGYVLVDHPRISGAAIVHPTFDGWDTGFGYLETAAEYSGYVAATSMTASLAPPLAPVATSTAAVTGAFSGVSMTAVDLKRARDDQNAEREIRGKELAASITGNMLMAAGMAQGRLAASGATFGRWGTAATGLAGRLTLAGLGIGADAYDIYLTAPELWRQLQEAERLPPEERWEAKKQIWFSGGFQLYMTVLGNRDLPGQIQSWRRQRGVEPVPIEELPTSTPDYLEQQGIDASEAPASVGTATAPAANGRDGDGTKSRPERARIEGRGAATMAGIGIRARRTTRPDDMHRGPRDEERISNAEWDAIQNSHSLEPGGEFDAIATQRIAEAYPEGLPEAVDGERLRLIYAMNAYHEQLMSFAAGHEITPENAFLWRGITPYAGALTLQGQQSFMPQLRLVVDFDGTYSRNFTQSTRDTIYAAGLRAGDIEQVPGVAVYITGLQQSHRDHYSAFETPESDAGMHGVPETYGSSGDVTGFDLGVAASAVSIVTARPHRLGHVVHEKLEMDGVEFDDVRTKDHVGILRETGRTQSLREHVSFKLQEFLLEWAYAGPNAQHVFMGDNAELDALTASIFVDVVRGNLSPEGLEAVLRDLKVLDSSIPTVVAMARAIRTQEDFDPQIIIHLVNEAKPPEILRVFGDRITPTHNYFQAALASFESGLVNQDWLVKIARGVCDESGATPQMMQDWFDDAVRRGLIDVEFADGVASGLMRAGILPERDLGEASGLWREAADVYAAEYPNPADASGMPDYQAIVNRMREQGELRWAANNDDLVSNASVEGTDSGRRKFRWPRRH